VAYRIFFLITALLWATMSFLFVRSEFLPSSTAPWLEIPPAHMLTQFFHHEEFSELDIKEGRQKVGNLRIRPTRSNGDEPHKVQMTGDIAIKLPSLERQRITFEAVFLLKEEYALDALKLTVQLRDPALKLEIDINSAGAFKYVVRDEEIITDQRQGTIPSLIHDMQVAVPGLNVESLVLNQKPTELEARRAQLKLHNETIDVYRLVIAHSGAFQSEIDMSQLGRILRIQSIPGYEILSEGLEP